LIDDYILFYFIMLSKGMKNHRYIGNEVNGFLLPHPKDARESDANNMRHYSPGTKMNNHMATLRGRIHDCLVGGYPLTATVMIGSKKGEEH